MNIEYLKEIFNQYKENNKGLLTKLRYDDQLRKELIEITSFLPIEALISERVLYYQQGWKEPQLCPYCNKQKRKFRKLDKGLFPTCGSEECKKAGMSKGAKQPRNWKRIQEKMKATYKAKTGYEHNMQNPEFMEEYKENFAKTHNGITCGVQTKKAKKNLLKSYEENIKNKLEKLNYELIEYIEKTDEFVIKCKKCGNIQKLSREGIKYHYKMSLGLCENCDKNTFITRSKFEREIINEIKKFYTGKIIINKHISKEYELDIFIPEFNLAIEANGLYYHCELFKNKNYHFNKKKFVENQNINLIYIWEDDWYNKKDIIISRIKSKMNLSKKIYARNCTIKEVDGSMAKKFLEKNHLQGYIPSSYKIGLYYNDKLIMLMTFGKIRKLLSKNIKDNYYELYRMCSKKGYNIIGGFSKLLKYFIKTYKPNKIITFVDLCWSKFKNGYDKIGFTYISTSIDYYWFFKNKKHYRTNFTKQKLIQAGYSKDKSENQIMHEDVKAYKIYGSGNLKYEMIF